VLIYLKQEAVSPPPLRVKKVGVPKGISFGSAQDTFTPVASLKARVKSLIEFI
jgi:hypothetical protein